MNKDLDSASSVQAKKSQTVGEHFDEQIQMARQRLEELCIKKAKLEALGMINHPYPDLIALLTSYPF